jgi:hypothetical protein
MSRERELRNVGGARNPYALAEFKAKKKIDWDRKTPSQVRHILALELGMPYNQLFSPKNHSPVFSGPRKCRKGASS